MPGRTEFYSPFAAWSLFHTLVLPWYDWTSEQQFLANSQQVRAPSVCLSRQHCWRLWGQTTLLLLKLTQTQMEHSIFIAFLFFIPSPFLFLVCGELVIQVSLRIYVVLPFCYLIALFHTGVRASKPSYEKCVDL